MSDIEHRSGSEDDGKPVFLGKKKKKDKEKGYQMFEAEDSEDEPITYDDRVKAATPKLKKSRPSFKFAVRKEVKLKNKEKEKEEKKDASEKDKKEEKEARRRERKFKDKDRWRKKKKAEPTPVVAEVPVFGVPLNVAVQRSPSHDGIPLPVVFRECVDYIEEHGLLYEGIYRVSGVKSKVQQLKDCYNRQQPAYLYEHEPSIVASLLKQFLRELPEPVLTDEHMPKFEEASVIKNGSERIEQLKALLSILPSCNRELLSWTIVHMGHVISKEKINKMGIQNVSIVLSPTMRISHRVLNVLFMHAKHLFAGVSIKRYVPPLQPTSSRWSVDLPDSEEAIKEELQHQESLLNHLHQEMSRHTIDPDKEEKLWEVQRVVTQLKRKLKLTAKTNAAKQMEKEQLAAGSMARTDPNRRSINAAELNFALQTISRQSSRSNTELTNLSALNRNYTPGSSLQELTGGKSSIASIPSQLELSSHGSPESFTTPEEQTPVSPEAHLPYLPSETTNIPEDNMKGHVVVAAENKMEKLDIHDESSNIQSGETNFLEEMHNNNTTVPSTHKEPEEFYGSMKESSSLDSDITLSAVSAGISTSLSQTSFNDYKTMDDSESGDVTSDTPTPQHPLVTEETESANEPGLDTSVKSIEFPEVDPTEGTHSSAPNQGLADSGKQLSDEALQVVNQGDNQQTDASLMQETTQLAEENTPCTGETTQITGETTQITGEATQITMEATQLAGETTSLKRDMTQRKEEAANDVLVPEKLHQASEPQSERQPEVVTVTSLEEDLELRRLIAEEAQLIWEEEELIATSDELKQKISTETVEIERLEEEIAEYEELRSITTQGHSSEYHSSDDSYLSTSDTDPPSDVEAYEELDGLVAQRDLLAKQNHKLETSNGALVKKIHDERMICLGIKIQIRLLQQQLLGSPNGYEEQSLL